MQQSLHDRRDDGRGPGFPHPAGGFGTLDDVNFDCRRLAYPNDSVAIEVGLLDSAVFQRDFTIQSGRDAEDRGALDLRPDGIGINDGPAVDRADDPLDPDRPILRDFDLGHLRHVVLEGELKRDAPANPFR